MGLIQFSGLCEARSFLDPISCMPLLSDDMVHLWAQNKRSVRPKEKIFLPLIRQSNKVDIKAAKLNQIEGGLDNKGKVS